MTGRTIGGEPHDSDPVRPEEVWDRMAADPLFVAGMERAAEDHAAGRFRPYQHRRPSIPAPVLPFSQRSPIAFLGGVIAGIVLTLILGAVFSGRVTAVTMNPDPRTGPTGAAASIGEAGQGLARMPEQAPRSIAAAPIAPSDGVTEPPATFGGRATWFCSSTSPCTAGYGPADLIAAVDPSLGIARGTLLRVHHEGRSVVVMTVDVCACAGTRIIDLSSGAFVQLAPLAVGVIDVAVEELGGPTPPATTTDPVE